MSLNGCSWKVEDEVQSGVAAAPWIPKVRRATVDEILNDRGSDLSRPRTYRGDGTTYDAHLHAQIEQSGRRLDPPGAYAESSQPKTRDDDPLPPSSPWLVPRTDVGTSIQRYRLASFARRDESHAAFGRTRGRRPDMHTLDD